MQQIADKMNFQDPVQKYAECHSWDMSNSNATKYHEIKVGILDNTCFKENVPTFEILVGVRREPREPGKNVPVQCFDIIRSRKKSSFTHWKSP